MTSPCSGRARLLVFLITGIEWKAKDTTMRSLAYGILMVLLVMAYPALSVGGEAQAPLVGVRALMQSPEKFTQTIRVSGVVSQVVADSHILGLIDVEEFRTCQKVTCASLVLPVRWEGTLPEVGSELVATGKIQKDGERYLFVASDLKAVPAE